MLRAMMALTVAATLSGCMLALEEATLVEAGVGAGTAETGIALAARGSAAESILISDGIASSFRSVRFSPALRGPLSDSLAQLTANGERSVLLNIDRQGVITGNGYIVARLSPRNGIIYSRRGIRLGYVNRQALLIEYLRTGETRPIGAVRGFVRSRRAVIFADNVTTKPIGEIPANGIVCVTRIGDNGYWVELETGERGWVPAGSIALLAILAISQKIYTCGAQPGAIVTKSNRLVRYERCKSTPSGDDLVSEGRVLHVPTEAISEIWEGAVDRSSSPSFRMAALHSLRSGGLLYPKSAEYNLFPEGDPRSKGARTPGMMEAPQ